MFNTKGENMKNLSTTYPQAFPAMVYIGKSRWDDESAVSTCGWCETVNFKGATIRKIMKPTFRIMVQTIKEAKILEKLVHKELDAKFGPRAVVFGCCALRQGAKPNRSDEWWYCTTSEIEAVLTELTIKGDYRD
jgi:hypothetical protein